MKKIKRCKEKKTEKMNRKKHSSNTLKIMYTKTNNVEQAEGNTKYASNHEKLPCC